VLPEDHFVDDVNYSARSIREQA